MSSLQDLHHAPRNLRRKVFEFILERQASPQGLPSRADLRRAFADKTEDLDLHLEQLAREGLILLDAGADGTITVLPTFPRPAEIGLLGRFAAPLPTASQKPLGAFLGLDLSGLGVSVEPGLVAIQVQDNRMSDAGINAGDIALLADAAPARGDIVAVQECGALVLRRYVVLSGIPHLLAENPAAPTLVPAWGRTVHGVFWGLVRAEPLRRTVRTPSPAKRIVYAPQVESGAPMLTKDGLVAGGRPAAKPVQKILEPSSKRERKTKLSQGSSGWPKPPAGVQLNETRAGFRSKGTGRQPRA